MSIRRLGFAFVACLSLAACTLMHPRVERSAQKLECDATRDCTVVVTVSCERFYGCAMSVDYDLVLVLGRDKPTDLHWQLRGDTTAEFASNGIALDSSEFECRRDAPDRFSCRDRHSSFGAFKYTINVTVKDSTFGARGVPSLDPWIVNN